MKKLLLIVVALCCMISVSAQEQKQQLSLKEKVKKVEQINRQNQAFTQKLDSIVNDNNTKILFTYDHFYRRTNMKMVYGTSTVVIEQQFFYDALGHLTHTINNSLYYQDKIEYTYNNQGLVDEETEYELSGDNWLPTYKTNYEYDGYGNVLTAIEKEYEDGNWTNYRKMEYTYVARQLTKVLESRWGWDGDYWYENDMEEYKYDNAGNCIELLLSYKYVYDTDWRFDDKYVYEYNTNNDCIKETEYDYEDNEWVVDGIVEYTYDPTVPGSSIAGYDDIFENMTIKIKSKLLKVVETYFDDGEIDETVISILYYSKGAQVPESPSATLTIGPNPTSTILFIQADNLRQVEIYSMDGKMVMRLDKGIESVNVSALATGTHLLKATMNDGSVATEKFMKQ